MKKKLIVLFLILVLLFTFTSCGTGKYKVTDEGNNRIVIEYRKVGSLTRGPHISEESGVFTMNFNGYTWYSLSVIDRKTYESYLGKELIAESSNIKVVLTDETEKFGPFFPHVYANLMSLAGTEESYLLILNGEHPENRGYGYDYDYCITYSVNGTETVPDFDFTISVSEEEIKGREK
ncbi:MAG: hypothetical protein MJ171_04620 [Clostridia bacterium]|nr:hypothetical protein [Clostridia bacterium]